MADPSRNEISIDGVRYVSASQAAADFGFVRDYVTRLARTGKIRGRQLGRNWYVDRDALKRFSASQEHLREVRRYQLRRERIAEYRVARPEPKSPPTPGLSAPRRAQASKKITLADIVYVRSRDAARTCSLSAGYVARLAREKLVDGRLVDGSWYVSEQSLARFVAAQAREKELRRGRLVQLRREERRRAAI